MSMASNTGGGFLAAGVIACSAVLLGGAGCGDDSASAGRLDMGPDARPDAGRGGVADLGHTTPRNDGEVTPNGDAGSEPLRPMRDVLVEVVERRCEQAARCCAEGPYEFDEDRCLGHGGDMVVAALESEAANAADFDRAGAERCLTWYAGPGQACDAEMPVECVEPLIGRQATGEACAWTPECDDGAGFAQCVDQNAVGLGRCIQFTRGRAGDRCQWTCEDVGDRCSRRVDPENPEELSGAFCSLAEGLTCTSETSECVALRVEGEDCSTVPCAPGMRCTLDTLRCQRLPGAGEPCPDLYCDAALCVGGVCVPLPGPGEACDPDAWEGCVAGADCLPEGRCSPVLSSLLHSICRAYGSRRL